ncbi:MAG: PilZ domain-containing protein [Bacillota bacterium]
MASRDIALPRTSLGHPRRGERVKLCLPAGQYASFRVVRGDGVLLLRPRTHVQVAPGDQVVLERRARDQVFWFRERVECTSPLGVTCAVPALERETRLPVVLSVVYRAQGCEPVKTRMVDLSSRGMCFHAWEPVPRPGAELDLEFELYPHGDARARAVVRQVYGWTPGWPEVGVEFVEVGREAARVLAAFLRDEVPALSVV